MPARLPKSVSVALLKIACDELRLGSLRVWVATWKPTRPLAPLQSCGVQSAVCTCQALRTQHCIGRPCLRILRLLKLRRERAQHGARRIAIDACQLPLEVIEQMDVPHAQVAKLDARRALRVSRPKVEGASLLQRLLKLRHTRATHKEGQVTRSRHEGKQGKGRKQTQRSRPKEVDPKRPLDVNRNLSHRSFGYGSGAWAA